ncbi:MAG: hypothetical protein B6I34_08935 [Anaerolineaceae bacterium 4572_32.1]|nr:MAG: hypothetical protein B6I34_08935 [Anaerolineaceae bacterium 4572_32.1]
MNVVQLELSGELAQILSPYHDKLPALLELGLREWLKREPQESLALRERILQVLVASSQVEAPKPYIGERPYVRHTPVPITGKAVSELVVEQRGSL